MTEEVDYEEDEMNLDESRQVKLSAPPDASGQISGLKEGKKAGRVKGRGHEKQYQDEEGRYRGGRGGIFERIEQEPGAGPCQSIEGWIVFVTNVHPEAQEDDILDKFSEHGDVKNIHVNLDRRTGFVKGYALVEYETYEEALTTIKSLNGAEILGQSVQVGWAFTKK
eukprot:gene10073-13536_t